MTTREQYAYMHPFHQGYTVYMEGEWPGSPLKGDTNPYPIGSVEHREWNKGQHAAMLEAQDSEE